MKYLEQTLATYVYSNCNIYNIPIYFCNIYMKHLQHTSETTATIEIYVCNIGGELRLLGWELAACEHYQHRPTAARGFPLARLEMT